MGYLISESRVGEGNVFNLGLVRRYGQMVCSVEGAILCLFLRLFAESSDCVGSTFHRSMGLEVPLDWQTLPSSTR